MRPAIVLVGHEVHHGAPSPSGLESGTSIADQDLLDVIARLIAKGYAFVRLSEFLARYRQGGVALLTFDDGHRSVAEVAAPILLERNIPSVLFIVAETLGGVSMPFPMWLFALHDARELLGPSVLPALSHPLLDRIKDRGLGADLGQILTAPLAALLELFRSSFRPEELDELGRYLSEAAPEMRTTLRPDELTPLIESGLVELGSHSSSHRSFATLSPDEIETEIVDSIQALSRFTGRPASETPFAYPYGARTLRAQAIVKRCCSAGFTATSRPVSRLDSRAALPRINLNQHCGAALEGAIHGEGAPGALREYLWLALRTGPAWGMIEPGYRRLRPRRKAVL